jgi:hypothetical protein
MTIPDEMLVAAVKALGVKEPALTRGKSPEAAQRGEQLGVGSWTLIFVEKTFY